MNRTSAPLSTNQAMIWTGQRLQPDEPLYNMVLAFRINGEIDAGLFAAAFQALVDRCDALRSRFAVESLQPVQEFRDKLDYELPYRDFSTQADPEACLQAWQAEHVTRSFNLGDVLFDSALIKMADGDFIWYLNQHHLITDAWSTGLLYRQMSEFYALARQRCLDDAPAMPAYSDYAAFETQQRDSRFGQRAAEYWQTRLQHKTAASSFYRNTPQRCGGRTVRVPCRIGAERSQKLKKLAESERFRGISSDLSRFQLIATALVAWLYRLSGNSSLAIGMPTHGRSTATHKRTAGLFIQIFPLQVDVMRDDSFESLFARLAERAQGLMMNAVPGVSSIEHNQAFDVVLNYITAEFGSFDGMPMRSEWLHANHGDRNHLLRVQVEGFDQAEAFGVFFDMNSDVFSVDERQRAVRHFLVVLDALLDNSSSRIDMPVLYDDSEQSRLMQLAGIDSADGDSESSVVELFEQQVARNPGAPALICGRESLTYCELNTRSEHLASRLVAEGAAAGMRVAVALPRSIDAVVAILAVLKSGAAYVPVETSFPVQRIAWIIRDSGASFVVAHSAYTKCLPTDCKIVAIDEKWSGAIAALPTAGAADTAYVIYTSGSTGQPKGVEVRHRNLAAYLAWARDFYLEGQALTWALFSSFAFDLTVTSTFVPLISGGKLIVYPESTDKREMTIRKVVNDNKVDIIKLTPAHLALVQPMDLSTSTLRKLIVGGEDLKVDLARAISKYFDDRIEIYNEYGPTEATVACTVHRFNPQFDQSSSVPIGTAIANSRIYILDSKQKLQPLGVVGEICIGGAGVARGYLNKPQQTAASFVDDPYCDGQKMYRTGDLGRWNPDGSLAFLGRADHQIKVRGVRIEPAEIESALQQYPGISEAVVCLVARQRGVDQEAFCQQCGITGMHPDAQLDERGLCRICKAYEQDREQVMNYFGTDQDLKKIVADIRQNAVGDQDCIMLLSGGKDSTFALCQLVDLGLTPLVFTLDNGFISEGAKANMRRVVDKLGLELVVGETPAMNQIFADSLKRFSNVCNGCFKTIYTLSMNLARERGIKYICTGLSRGQIFETRVADLFKQRIFDPSEVDATIIEARKAYHRADDAVSRTLDVSAFAHDEIFEEIKYVDFYRYTDVSLDEMLAYLGSRVPWVRPADTGRSTNCLINEAGIYVHKKERGYHNYSLPYSWDVRLGHKKRDAAREELDDNISLDNVQRILSEVSYQVEERIESRNAFLTAYYVAEAPLDSRELNEFLRTSLPDEYIPASFVHLRELPLAASGKLDRSALPLPDADRPDLREPFVVPDGAVQRKLASIWSDVLGISSIGANDNFFNLGGDSILNIQIVSRARKAGLNISPQQIFDHPTIAELANVADGAGQALSEQGPITGEVGLSPIQLRFFDQRLACPDHYNQAVLLDVPGNYDPLVIQESLRHLLAHHDALRSRFDVAEGLARQFISAPAEVQFSLAKVTLRDVSRAEQKAAIQRESAKINSDLELESGRLFRAVFFDLGDDQPATLLIVIHHLVIDGVSWWILLEDLDTACKQLALGLAVELSPKSTSVSKWADALRRYANERSVLDSVAAWQQLNDSDSALLGLGERDPEAASASGNCVSVSIDATVTRKLLTDVTAGWRTQAPDILIAALIRVIHARANIEKLQIDIEGHGREDIGDDASVLRTVGWFTSIYPVTFVLSAEDDLADSVRRVRDTTRAVPHRGLSYGVLKYLAKQASIDSLPSSSVLFNYLGKWDRAAHDESVIRLQEPIMLSSSPQNESPYQLEVDAIVFDGCLTVNWRFDDQHIAAHRMEALVSAYRSELLALIEYCSTHSDQRMTPADFPDANLAQDELDELLAEFGDSQ